MSARASTNLRALFEGVIFFVTKKNPLTGKYTTNFKRLYKNRGIESNLEKFKHCPADSVKGEISSVYLNDPGAGELIHKHFPNVKILAFLRDPVERAYSHYWFARNVTFRGKS